MTNHLSKPLVSIVIPFYSRIDWLMEAVDSALTQTYKNFEIIVINDGSVEDDTEFQKKYGKYIIYIKRPNAGTGAARNLGIDIAKGDYIAFLDSDDIWYEKKLEVHVAHMKQNNSIWSHTNYLQFNDGNPSQISSFDLHRYSGRIYPKSLLATHIATPCVMIKASFLRNRDDLRFQPKMRYGQDYYLWLLLSAEVELHLVEQPLCKVRIRGTNTAKRARAHIQLRAQIWELLRNHPLLFKKPRFAIGIKALYQLCEIQYRCILRVEKMGFLPSRYIELFSRILYLPSYIGFKLMSRLI